MSDFVTVRVGNLPEEVWSGTDNLPHEVGTDLKRGTVADLATYIAGIIDASAGIAFNPLKISDGQTLPVTTVNEWVIVGQGTYLQSGGFPNVVCVEDINIVISNGTSWSLGFGIAVDGVDTSQFVKITGNQTVEDVKTFVASPIVPDATTANQAVNFGQVIPKLGTTSLDPITGDLHSQKGFVSTWNEGEMQLGSDSGYYRILYFESTGKVGSGIENLSAILFANPEEGVLSQVSAVDNSFHSYQFIGIDGVQTSFVRNGSVENETTKNHESTTFSKPLIIPNGTASDEAVNLGQLDTKLDASAYNDRFKGKFTTLQQLETAFPTANAGDYAQVDAGAGSLVRNYNYDLEDGWVLGGTGSGATSTDTLIEGSTNLYFTTARVLSTLLSGISFVTGGAIVSTDSVLVAFGKLQKQITDAIAELFWTKTGDNIRNNNVGNVELKMATGKRVSFLDNANAEVGSITQDGTFRAGYNGFKIGDGNWSIDREGSGDSGAMRFIGKEAGGIFKEIFKFVSFKGRQYFNVDSNSNFNVYGNIIIDVPPPTDLVAIVSSTGGTLNAQSRTYRITSLNANGESTGSLSVQAITTGSTSSIALSWTAVLGASSYRIYNVFGGSYFTSSTNTFTDIGSAGTTGTVPTTNTAVAISLLNNGKVIIPPATAPNEAVNLSQLANENNVYLSHEFLNTASNDFVGFAPINSGTTAGSNTNATPNNVGILRITSSTTANSGGSIRSAGFNFVLKGGEVFTEIINPLLFTNTTNRMGIHDSTNSAEPASGVYFEYVGNGAISLRTANGGSRNTATTITTLALNTWFKVRFTVNANATSILGEVFNNVGVLIASQTVTTNIPTTARLLNVCSIVTNSGTVALPLLDVDFISTRLTLNR